MNIWSDIMSIFDELIQNKALLFSMVSVIVATILFIIYMIIKQRKEDQEEIEEIMYSLVEPKRKPLEDLKEVEEDIKGMNEAVQEVTPIMEEKSKDTLDIESMLEQMQKDLNAKAEDVVATFEQEQEENSIISYQELVNSLKGKRESIKVEQTAPIKEVNQVIEEVREEPHNEQLSMDAVLKVEPEKKEKKFKTTDFISPVYGKMEEHLEYPTVPQFHKKDAEIEKELETYDSSLTNKNIDNFLGDFDFDSSIEINSLEQTLDMKPLSDEIKQNDEFLQALKEFRKNLD